MPNPRFRGGSIAEMTTLFFLLASRLAELPGAASLISAASQISPESPAAAPLH